MFMYLIAVILIIPSIAYAYLDPGTGNIIINLLIGGLAAIFFSLKGLFYFLIKKDKKSSHKEEEFAQIVIFSEGNQYWSTFKPIVNSLIETKQYFRYYTLDVSDPALLIENDYMKSKFLGYGALAIYRFSQLQAKLMLATTPNIGSSNYPLKRPAKIEKMVHVFHSINDISAYEKGSLDHYDEVILVGEFQAKSIQEIERKRNLTEKKLISLGLPYLDEYIQNKKNIEKAGLAKTVLIGSSWGSKGCLQSYGTDFIRKIALAGYDIIVRPHPQSLKTEKHLLAKFKHELNDLKNITWDETVSPTKSMNTADILISDTSSIRFDFAFIYEKPVITLDIKSEEMPGYERDDLSEIWTDTSSSEIGFIIKRDNIGELPACIERAFIEYDSTKIRLVRDKTVKNYARSGEFISAYLCERVKELN